MSDAAAAPLERIPSMVAAELGLPAGAVSAVADLLDAGNTVPFISRYRKEATGGLDDLQVESIREKLDYRRELEQRRATVLESIDGQGKLTPELKKAIEAADTKTALEDLYLPYRPKRRTRAVIARERGLEPLAERMWDQLETEGDPVAAAGRRSAGASRAARRPRETRIGTSGTG